LLNAHTKEKRHQHRGGELTTLRLRLVGFRTKVPRFVDEALMEVVGNEERRVLTRRVGVTKVRHGFSIPP